MTASREPWLPRLNEDAEQLLKLLREKYGELEAWLHRLGYHDLHKLRTGYVDHDLSKLPTDWELYYLLNGGLYDIIDDQGGSSLTGLGTGQQSAGNTGQGNNQGGG